MSNRAPEEHELAAVRAYVKAHEKTMTSEVWLALHTLCNFAEHAEPRLRKLEEFATFLRDCCPTSEPSA